MSYHGRLVDVRPLRLALSGLGAPALPAYYAAPSTLTWSASSLKGLHDTLVGIDEWWQGLMSQLPIDLVPGLDAKGKAAFKAMAAGPLPMVSDIACILEAVAGHRPLVSTFQGILEGLKDRAAEIAGAFAFIGSLAASGALAVLVGVGAGAASVVGLPSDLITVPTAAELGTIAGLAAASAAIWGALAAVLDGLKHGTLSRDDYRALVRAGAAATGQNVSDKDINASADSFYGTQNDVTGRTAAQKKALAEAKLKSAAASTALKKACKARGGAYSFALHECVLPPTKDEKIIKTARDAGIANSAAAGASTGIPWWGWALGGLAAVAGGAAIVRRLRA